jgi:Tfp pilus assembly protein PilF
MLHYSEQRYRAARGDLERALNHGADPAAAYYGKALVLLAQDDRTGALASVEEALRLDPQNNEARTLRDRLIRSQPRPPGF